MERDPKKYEGASVAILGVLNIARHIRNRRNGWRYGRLDFIPLLDRPALVSLSPSADGPIGTLARIELNARDGRLLDEGLDHPNQLNQPGAP